MSYHLNTNTVTKYSYTIYIYRTYFLGLFGRVEEDREAHGKRSTQQVYQRRIDRTRIRGFTKKEYLTEDCNTALYFKLST